MVEVTLEVHHVLEDLHQVIKTPQHLRRARECWWEVLGSTCLVNQMWAVEIQL